VARQQRLGDPGQGVVALDQVADARLEGLRRRRTHLKPEPAQHPPQAHLDVMPLGLQELARGQQRAHLLRRGRLAVHRPEPPHPHQMRDAAGILAVGLDRHRLQRGPHMPRLQQLDRQPGIRHPGEQPLRQRTRLEADPPHRAVLRGEPGNQGLRLARHLGLA
jgi:hypothetical protein